MKLLIISNLAHYFHYKKVYGWGPTIDEINHLANLFDEITHIGCLSPDLPPPSSVAYQSNRIRFVPLPPAGGENLLDKLQILKRLPLYVRTILRELPDADAAMVRCPSNVGLIAIVLLALARQPRYRWAKYAGNWKPVGSEPWSYAFQRWWLNKGFHRGLVTVNGHWTDQPGHVYSFLNPSLMEHELESTHSRMSSKRLTDPIKLICVGRIETAKGIGRALDIAQELCSRGIAFHLDVLGDGPERSAFETLVRSRELDGHITFRGWLSKSDLVPFYEQAHFLLFPSAASEGWPKVVSEGMNYGVIPLANAISSIPQILTDIGCGRALPSLEPLSYVETLQEYISLPEQWLKESRAGMAAASLFTYEQYLRSLNDMFQDAWGITL